MKIYEAAVRKPITTLLLFTGVVLLGLFSFQRLSIDLYPEIDPPYITVFTYYQGANAEDIETNVTRLIEDNLNTVSKLKRLSTLSHDNYSIVLMEFEWGTNLDDATNSVRDALSRIQRQLPTGTEQPVLFKFSTNLIPVLLFSVTAKESYPALREIIDDQIANPLNRIDGVGAISVTGGAKRQIRVEADPAKLEAYHMTIEQIGAAIQKENLNLPAGTLDIGNMNYPLRVEGEFSGSAVLPDLVVGQFGGKPILLRDVARVNDSLADATLVERRDGEPALRFTIQKQSGANSVKIAKEVLAMLPELQRNLPPDVKIEVLYNQAEFIQNSISSLAETVLYAGLFVALVILFFLGRWRATFIIVLTIPVSLIVAFIYLYLTGNSINIISLSSLSIAIGMVVDDAIVVLENITSHLERGSGPREAAIYGTNEVGLAVMAATLTVVAVFLPLTMTTGISGIMFKQLGWSVTIVILVSVVAALTLTPMLASKLLKARPKDFRATSNVVQRGINRILDALDNAYATTLTWVAKHRAVVIWSSAAIFILSLFLLPMIRTEFMPVSDNSRIAATITTVAGARTDYTGELADRLEAAIRKENPEIALIASNYGTADADNIFAAFGCVGTNIINLDIKLVKPEARKRTMNEVADRIRAVLQAFPEVEQLQVTPGGNNGGGMGGAPSIDVNVIGYDLDRTTAIAERLAEKMRAIPGTRDVKVKRDPYKMEYNIDFDRHKLAEYGLNTATAATFVRDRIYGMRASKFREDGKEYDIVVRYDKPFRETLADVENIQIANAQGGTIRLGDVARIEQFLAPPTIERENRQRIVTVTCGMNNGSMATIVDGIHQAMTELDLPNDIGYSIGGTAKDQQESSGDMLTLLVLVIVLVYIMMASQFESFKSPFIIMLSLPFSFSGVFIALLITNSTLNLISMIGAIMLVGIVVKNGIVLVDYINLLKARGYATLRAVIEGGRSRLRPVLMTALTTALGMLPLALSRGEGSEMWKPMGIAVIGGLVFSTLLTLIVIPAVYATMAASSARGMRRRQIKQLKREQQRLS